MACAAGVPSASLIRPAKASDIAFIVEAGGAAAGAGAVIGAGVCGGADVAAVADSKGIGALLCC